MEVFQVLTRDTTDTTERMERTASTASTGPLGTTDLSQSLLVGRCATDDGCVMCGSDCSLRSSRSSGRVWLCSPWQQSRVRWVAGCCFVHCCCFRVRRVFSIHSPAEPDERWRPAAAPSNPNGPPTLQRRTRGGKETPKRPHAHVRETPDARGEKRAKSGA